MNPILSPLFIDNETRTTYVRLEGYDGNFGISGEKVDGSPTQNIRHFESHKFISPTVKDYQASLTKAYNSTLRRKNTLKRVRSKRKTQRRRSKHGNVDKAKFLPRIDTQKKLLTKSKSIKKSTKIHHEKTKRKTFLKRSQERSKKFHKYLKRINQTINNDGSPQSRESGVAILPPHLKMIEQQSYQTQSFAPNQVYAQTININITNNANNINKIKHNEIQKENTNKSNAKSKSHEIASKYWSEPMSFPFPSKSNNKSHTYRAEGKPSPQQTGSIFGIDGRVSFNEWINQYTKDKQEFNSLQAFTQYKLQQLKDLLANRQIFEILTHRSSSKLQLKPTWGGSPKVIRNNEIKSNNNNIISDVSFKSALCIDMIATIAQSSDAKYSEVLSIIATVLTKNIFHRSSADKLVEQSYIDTKSGNHAPNEVDHEESWFHDINNLTLQKLSGLRNYKEKWEDTKNRIITVKTDYIKLKAVKLQIDDRKIKEKVFKAWALNVRQTKLAKEVAQKMSKKHDYIDRKKIFIAWRHFGNRINRTYYKRKLFEMKCENDRLNAENTMLKETEKQLIEQVNELKTSLSIISDHLYCDTNQECEERTILRIHKMLSQLKSTLHGTNASFVLNDLGFDQYLNK